MGGGATKGARETPASLIAGRPGSKYSHITTSTGRKKEDDTEANKIQFRACDRCHLERKTSRFGGEDAPWLCTACQLLSPPGSLLGGRGNKAEARDRLPLLGEDAAASVSSSEGLRSGSNFPRPRFSHTGIGAAVDAVARSGQLSDKQLSSPPTSRRPSAYLAQAAASTGLETKSEDTRLRKQFSRSMSQSQAMVADGKPEEPRLRKQLSRSMSMVNRSMRDSHKDCLKTLQALVAGAKNNNNPVNQEASLPGGYRCGDKVQSLLFRLRAGTQVLELGHEGTIAWGGRTAALGSAGPSEEGGGLQAAELGKEPRLLVQFAKGYDWVLSPSQVCPLAIFPTTKSAGLAGGFSWGDKVKCLLTRLKPANTQRGLCLGDSGVVIGPGQMTGKVAVRFDADGGEWSMWPNVLCKAEVFNNVVLDKLPGNLMRGDRVRIKGKVRGGSSSINRGAEVEEGEEGVVMGPGHISGRVLVQLDPAGRQWSLLPEQVSQAGRHASSSEV